MRPSAQRWCDMAKATKTESVDDLNAEGTGDGTVVEELNAGGGEDSFDDDKYEEAADPEYVVLKGNSIRHDGAVYRENTVIPVSGLDAQRLLSTGVIADVQILRQRALSEKPGVKVTTE